MENKERLAVSLDPDVILWMKKEATKNRRSLSNWLNFTLKERMGMVEIYLPSSPKIIQEEGNKATNIENLLKPIK